MISRRSSAIFAPTMVGDSQLSALQGEIAKTIHKNFCILYCFRSNFVFFNVGTEHFANANNICSGTTQECNRFKGADTRFIHKVIRVNHNTGIKGIGFYGFLHGFPHRHTVKFLLPSHWLRKQTAQHRRE